jgi:HlyD family secretion protein
VPGGIKEEGLLDADLAPELAGETPPSVVDESAPQGRDRIAEIILHSEPVAQILGVPPHWLARWGATVMVGVVGFLVALAWLIHYPDIVAARVVVTTPLPPATVVAQASGHLEGLRVRDGDWVENGDVVARIHTSADPGAVKRLETVLAAWQSEEAPSKDEINGLLNLPLGELKADVAAAVRAYDAHSWHVTADPIGVQLRSLQTHRAPLQDKIERLQRQQTLLTQEVPVAERGYVRTLELARQQNTSLQILDDRERAVIQAKRALEANLVELANSRLELARIEQTITELSIRDQQERHTLLVALNEAIKTLSGRLALWERTYVLRTPIAGKVSLSNFWTDSQFVRSGDEVLAIVPVEAGAPIGKVALPISRAGSVQVGQQVFIRLDNYPSEQFGQLKGQIAAISPVPLGGRYAVEVALPDGLVTTFGEHLSYQQEMQGQAEIVVEDLRVIDRLLYQFRRLFRNNAVVPQ